MDYERTDTGAILCQECKEPDMNQTITIKCPSCGLGQDIKLSGYNDEDAYLNGRATCAQCHMYIFVSLTADKQEFGELPF
jgi:formate dehydrogenase maturation protein FdhE